MPPLWLTSATEPSLRSMSRSGGRKNVSTPGGENTPRQLGPITGNPCSTAIAFISFWISALPASANPPEMTMAPPTPALTQSRSTPQTSSERTLITARSIFAGISAIERYTVSPNRVPPAGLTQKVRAL